MQERPELRSAIKQYWVGQADIVYQLYVLFSSACEKMHILPANKTYQRCQLVVAADEEKTTRQLGIQLHFTRQHQQRACALANVTLLKHQAFQITLAKSLITLANANYIFHKHESNCKPNNVIVQLVTSDAPSFAMALSPLENEEGVRPFAHPQSVGKQHLLWSYPHFEKAFSKLHTYCWILWCKAYGKRLHTSMFCRRVACCFEFMSVCAAGCSAVVYSKTVTTATKSKEYIVKIRGKKLQGQQWCD